VAAPFRARESLLGTELAGNLSTEPVARDALESLCTIYVLSEISRHLEWFLCERLLSRKQVRRVPRLLNRYYERLMQPASGLADAFELPAPVNSAIAADDYVAAVMAGRRVRVAWVFRVM
jgi:hypothetical protein